MRIILSTGDKKLIADGYATTFLGHINRTVTHGEVKASCRDVVVTFPDGTTSLMTKEAFDSICEMSDGDKEIFLTEEEKAAIGELADVAPLEDDFSDLSETFPTGGTIVKNEELMKDTIPAKPGRPLQSNESFDVKTGKILDEFGLEASNQ